MSVIRYISKMTTNVEKLILGDIWTSNEAYKNLT